MNMKFKIGDVILFPADAADSFFLGYCNQFPNHTVNKDGKIYFKDKVVNIVKSSTGKSVYRFECYPYGMFQNTVERMAEKYKSKLSEYIDQSTLNDEERGV